jgi:hypothetical protein
MKNTIFRITFLAIITLSATSWKPLDSSLSDCFALSKPLEFGDKLTGTITIKEICKTDLKKLKNLPIYGSNDNGLGIEFNGKYYKNCEDGSSFEPLGTNYAVSMSSFYKKNCQLLNDIAAHKIQKPVRTYIDNFDLSKLDQIPAALFVVFLADDEANKFKNSPEYKRNLDYLAANKLIKNYSANALSLSFEFYDYRYEVNEIIRADFNNDGIEDISMNVGVYSIKSSYKSYYNIIATKRFDYDILSQIMNLTPLK